MASPAGGGTQVHKLIEKTQDYDSAERYMATTDLCTLLVQETFKLDSTTEKLVVSAVLKQLDDKSNDVQSVAVKCLAILLKRVQEEQVGDISEKLCILILSDGQAMLRDIYSIGLKTLITDVPEKMGPKVASKLTSRLQSGISGVHHDDIKRECLDNMAELLRRFGHLFMGDHEQIMTTVLTQLSSSKPVIRKKAASCLGALAVVSSDALLNRLVEKVLEMIEPASTNSDTRTLIQTIGTISRTVGYRLGRHLDRLIPLVIKFCGDPEDENQHSDAANELREHCFPGLESFVLRCPREVTPYMDQILALSFAFIKYDPNYSYNDDGGDVDAMDEDADQEQDGEQGQEEEDGYGGSDDDDTSWKVRKAAIKVITAVVVARPDMLQRLYDDYLDLIVNRFKEREENVRLDVLQCLGSMLHSSLASTSALKSEDLGGSQPLLRSPSSLGDKGDRIINAARKQLQGPSVKSKSAIFTILRTLVQVTRGNLEKHLKDLVGDSIKVISTEKNQSLKLDALTFLHSLFQQHPAEVMQPYIPIALPHILAAINEDWYKIIAEAMRTVGTVVVSARPMGLSGSSITSSGSFDYANSAEPIYKAILARLEVHDIDQEIKECAITTMGKLFAHFGDALLHQLPVVLGHLKKRMENDITRIPTLRSLDIMAQSPLLLDLSPVLLQSTQELAQFLRQQSRVLKQQTLLTLDSLVNSPSATLNDDNCQTLLLEASSLINDSDLLLAQLTLKLAQRIFVKFPSAAASIAQYSYRPAIELSGSPLLQGQSQKMLVSFLKDLVTAGTTGMTFDNVFSALYQRALISTGANGELSSSSSSSSATNKSGSLAAAGKQSVSNVASCIAGICSVVAPNVRNSVVVKLAQDLAPGDEGRRHLSLLCIGELGHSTDLSSSATDLKALILACFDSPAEEIKTAASFALGHLAVGNMETYLPAILDTLTTSKHQYLLLAALKEVFLVHADNNVPLDAFMDRLLAALKMQITAEEEGVRNIVAECLGIATFLNPQQIIPMLVQLVDSGCNEKATWTITTAFRYALTRPVTAESAPIFHDVLARFVTFLCSEDLDVRKAALVLINTTVYYNASVLEDLLGTEINPQLVETLKFKQERIVDLGPFKHKVDDGLPLRKTALTCIETLLESNVAKKDLDLFLRAIVENSLTDDQHKLHAHQIICKICVVDPSAIVGEVEHLIAPLEKTIVGKKARSADAPVQVGPEAERAMDVIKSALRVVVAVNAMSEAKNSRLWSEFVVRVSAVPAAVEMLASETAEPTESA